MPPKIYRFAIGFFVVLTVVALTALYHVMEESVFFKETYGASSVNVYPLWAVLAIGVIGSVAFSILHAKKKKDA
jgi:hypothetical protein